KLLDEDGELKEDLTKEEKDLVKEVLGVKSVEEVKGKDVKKAVTAVKKEVKKAKETVKQTKKEVQKRAGTPTSTAKKRESTSKGTSNTNKESNKGNSTNKENSSNKENSTNKGKGTNNTNSGSNKGDSGSSNTNSGSSNTGNSNSGNSTSKPTPAPTPKPEPKVEWKTETTKTESIAFGTDKKNDSNLEKGKEKVEREGRNGSKVTKCEVKYVDGKKTSETKNCTTSTTAATNKVVLVGTKEPAPVVNVGAMEQEIFRLINAERAKVGSPPLKWSGTIGSNARNHANYLTDNGITRGMHVGPYSGKYGEVAYTGGTGAGWVVATWMNSPGHKPFLLSPEFTHIGVGVSKTGEHAIAQFGE